MSAWCLDAMRLLTMAFFAGMTFAAPAAAVEKLKMISDWAFQAQAAVFTNAIDKGYFADQGLEVTIDRGFGSADAITKLASGAYDVGFGDINSMIDFNTKNTDKTQMIAVAMIFDRPALSVFTLDPSIKTPKDLEGKKVVTSAGEANLRLFPLFARLAKFDDKKVEFVTVAPQLREQLLLKGTGDAATGFYYVSYMNFKAIGADMPRLHSFLYADYGLDLYGNAIVFTKAFTEQRPETVKKFNVAIARSMQDVVKTPAATIPSIKKRDGVVDETIELERLNIIVREFVATPYVKANGFGDIDRDRMAKAIGEIKEALGLPTTPTVDDVFTDKFLPPKKDRMF